MSTITQQSPQLASAEPAHPVSEMIDATEVLYRLLKDRRRRRIYGQAGIGIYWIVNMNSRKIEVYAEPNSDGYASRVDYAPGEHVAVIVDGATIGTVAVADILP
jgi:hypothetical protein